MDILNVVKPQNKKFVAKMVEYGDKNKYDDKDKNNEYFQVIVCPKELITDMAPGDLVSMEGRKMIEKKIDG